MCKDVLQVHCLALIVVLPRACHDGNGHTVHGKVHNNLCDAWQQLHIQKVHILHGGALEEVFVNSGKKES